MWPALIVLAGSSDPDPTALAMTLIPGLQRAVKLQTLVSLISLPLCVPRLHDTGKTGHWTWLTLIPLAGPLALLALCLQPSQQAPNRWDAPPAS